jgi:chloride channel protein, CIC family
VQLGQLLEATGPERRQAQPDDSTVAAVGRPRDESERLRAADELDGAVVPQQERIGDVADGRAVRIPRSADREEKLVLRGCEVGLGRPLLAPVQESPQLRSELEQPAIVGVRDAGACLSMRHEEKYRITMNSRAGPEAIARTSVGRIAFLCGLSAGIGLLAGGAAWVLLHAIALLTNVLLFRRVGWTLPSFADLDPGPWLLVVAAGGGLVVSLLAKWSPVIRGHGIPEAMEAVLERQSRISPRAAVAKPLSAAVAIGTGGPFGAEGPVIVTGGALGSLVGQVVRVSPAERKILLACGAAGGMAATFGTPLAAVVLAIELLLFEFSPRVFVPLVVSSAAAAGVHSLAFGSSRLFAVPPQRFAGLSNLPLYAIAGVACGLLAVFVTKGLHLTEAAYRRLPIDEFWHPVLGGLGFGLVGLFVPRALGVGYDAIDDVLAGRLAVTVVAVLLVAKLVAWWVALASGTSGGTLAPILLIGGCFGFLMGSAGHHIAPGLGVSAESVALVAMAATFGAATRAPFASMVFLFELTRDYDIILPLMLATVVAVLVANALMDESLMTEKLARRGIRVHNEFEVDVLRTARVGEVMTRDVMALPASSSVEEVRRRFETGPHGAYPVVDEAGRVVGIIARADLLADAGGPAVSASDVASRDVVTVEPHDPVLLALRRMIDEGVEHLPVVVDGHLVGICTRTDILRARVRQLDHERRQEGWRGGPVRRLRSSRQPGS